MAESNKEFKRYQNELYKAMQIYQTWIEDINVWVIEFKQAKALLDKIKNNIVSHYESLKSFDDLMLKYKDKLDKFDEDLFRSEDTRKDITSNHTEFRQQYVRLRRQHEKMLLQHNIMIKDIILLLQKLRQVNYKD